MGNGGIGTSSPTISGLSFLNVSVLNGAAGLDESCDISSAVLSSVISDVSVRVQEARTRQARRRVASLSATTMSDKDVKMEQQQQHDQFQLPPMPTPNPYPSFTLPPIQFNLDPSVVQHLQPSLPVQPRKPRVVDADYIDPNVASHAVQRLIVYELARKGFKSSEACALRRLEFEVVACESPLALANSVR